MGNAISLSFSAPRTNTCRIVRDTGVLCSLATTRDTVLLYAKTGRRIIIGKMSGVGGGGAAAEAADKRKGPF